MPENLEPQEPFDIERLAELARLSLKPGEKAKLDHDLKNILRYVSQLQELNLQGVQPTTHVLELSNVFRPDKVLPAQISEDVLHHAPRREGRFFKVPKVIGQSR